MEVIHKPCGHGRGRGRGVYQMYILLHKQALFRKMVREGEGGQNIQKLSTWFVDDPLLHPFSIRSP